MKPAGGTTKSSPGLEPRGAKSSPGLAHKWFRDDLKHFGVALYFRALGYSWTTSHLCAQRLRALAAENELLRAERAAAAKELQGIIAALGERQIAIPFIDIRA